MCVQITCASSTCHITPLVFPTRLVCVQEQIFANRLFYQISQHVCVSYILAARTPILREFTMLENRNTGKSVKIIEEGQGSWRELVPGFWLPGHTTQVLLGMANYTPVDACREVFRMWLDGGDKLRIPRTWNTVIEVIDETLNNARLGRKIRAVLNGQ